MSVFQVLKIGRKLHPNTVLIIDNYDKYYVYDRDCYVIYQILNFDIKGKKNLFIWNRIEYLPYLVKKLKEQKNKTKYQITFDLEKSGEVWELRNLNEIDRQKIHGLY